MKNILKYTVVAAAMVALLAACEEFEDHTVTVNGAPTLAYVSTGEGGDNLFTTKILHRPIGSEGSFSTEFAIQCNTPIHKAATVSLSYDASLVERYNAAHDTDYAVLPEEYLVVENATLTLLENRPQTEETVKISLDETADLAALTENTTWRRSI